MQVDIEKIIPVTEARDKFNKVVDEVENSDHIYVFTKNGKPASVMVGVNHLEKLTGETHTDIEAKIAEAPGNDSVPATPNTMPAESVTPMDDPFVTTPTGAPTNEPVVAPDNTPATPEPSAPVEPAPTTPATPPLTTPDTTPGPVPIEQEVATPAVNQATPPVPAPDATPADNTPGPDPFATPPADTTK